MNVHRKDRAKLKEFSGDTSPVSDETAKVGPTSEVNSDKYLEVDLELRLGPEPHDHAKRNQHGVV
ncbi:hypothetical protein ACS0TY_016261 [Phlomoides rotata]